MSYGSEEQFRRCNESAWHWSTVTGGISLITGLLFSNTLCDMDLTQWNLVNATLNGALATSIWYGLKHSPGTLQIGLKLCKRDITRNDLYSEGLLTALTGLGLVVLPLLLLLWAIKGIAGMGVGICAESSPIYFGTTLVLMLIQGGLWLWCLVKHLQEHGLDVEKLKYQLQELAEKIKLIAIDLSRNGWGYAVSFYEKLQPTLGQAYDAVISLLRTIWEARPKFCCPNYWCGSEGCSLIR